MKQITLILIAFHFSSLMTAQTTIQGTVSDRIDPLPWANIYIKNSTTGTVTDDKGNFTLETKKGDTLVISYAGYPTKEIVIDTQKEMTVTLESAALDEVIVTAQGIRRCKKMTHYHYSTYTIEEGEEGEEGEEERSQFITPQTVPTLYPNPSSDGIFNLKMADTHKEVQIYVTNILGQQLQSRMFQNTNNWITLDVSSLRTGIYLINSVADGKSLPTQKAIRK